MLTLATVSLAVAGATILTAIYRYILYPALLSPLAKIPSGHWTAHFSPVWILYLRYTDTENEAVFKLHQKKGPILRLGPNELSVNCYEGGLKTVYLGGFRRPDFYAHRFTNYG
jgi:hypothetical protein